MVWYVFSDKIFLIRTFVNRILQLELLPKKILDVLIFKKTFQPLLPKVKNLSFVNKEKITYLISKDLLKKQPHNNKIFYKSL